MPASTRSPKWHLLDFYSDEEWSSALTVYVNGIRFHIIADASKLGHDSDIGHEYHSLMHNIQSLSAHNGQSPAKCKEDAETDSGIDMSETPSSPPTEQQNQGDDDPEATLQRWMAEPLTAAFDDLVPEANASKQMTLQEWYHCPTRFCELIASGDGQELVAVQLDSTPDLEDRMHELLPKAVLPKYLTDKLDVECYKASDLTVLDTSEQPIGTPYHPCRVQHRETKQVYFLKIVDNSQIQPTKRELGIFARLKEQQLDQQIHVPTLEGLVTFDESGTTSAGKKQIMGFLQTDIPDPTPLTLLLDEDVPQKKRDAWAKEAGRIKDVLHEHKIIWGDAKADNFMVDKHDKLWIIDFGGSYTEGWVDAELNETLEGDDMGTEKIINALIDPVANTCDPEDDDADPENRDHGARNNTKRRRNDTTEVQGDSGRPTKSARRALNDADNDSSFEESDADADHELYCYCNEPESGRMIACDGRNCERRWFHFSCLALRNVPPAEDRWFCPDCRD